MGCRSPRSWAAGACLGLLALAISGTGCERSGGAGDGQGAVEVPRNVRVLTIAPMDLHEYLTISGPVRPVRGTDVSAEESGEVERIAKVKGARVDEGETLVLLDRGMLEAGVGSARATHALAVFNESRTRELFKANSVSEIEMRQAEARLLEAEAAVRMAEIRYERTAIKAPFRGIVANRYVELGQLVVPGMRVVRIVEPYVLKLEGAVTEREVHWVAENMAATVTFDGIDAVADGVVQWVGFEADPMTGKFPLEIHIDNSDLEIRPGVIGRARVLKATHRGVIAIPRDAVIPRPSGAIAYVAEGSVARQRRLELGRDQGLMVIVNAGLRAGDQLIVRGQRDVHDGSAVVIQEEAAGIDGTLPSDPDVVTQARATKTGGSVPTGDDR